jgi:hypothetical protein
MFVYRNPYSVTEQAMLDAAHPVDILGFAEGKSLNLN